MRQESRSQFRLAGWMVERWPLCLAAATLITLASLTQMSQLRFDDDFRNLFRTTQNEITSERNEVDDLTCLIMIHGPRLVTADGLRLVSNVHERLDSAEKVAAVTSMLSARAPRRVGKYFLPFFPPADASPDRIEAAANAATNHPLLNGQLLSDNQRATLITVQLNADVTSHESIKVAMAHIDGILKETLQNTPWRFELTGIPSIRMALGDVFTRDQWTFNLGGALVAILVAAITFRSGKATVIVLLGPLLGVLWSMAAMTACGQPLNIINGMVGPLTLAIGLTASVHMMYHYRRSYSATGSRHEAATTVLRDVAPACGWAALTTVLGFLTLGVAHLATIRIFGMICAMAVALTFVAVVLVLPAMCMTLRLEFHANGSRKKQRGLQWLDRVLLLITHHVVTRPRSYLIAGVTLVVGMLGLGWTVTPRIEISEALPTSGKALHSLNAIEKTFTGALPISAVIRWPEDFNSAHIVPLIEAAHGTFSGRSYCSEPLSLTSLAQSLPGETQAARLRELKHLPSDVVSRFLNLQARESYLFVRCQDVGTDQLSPVFRDVQQDLSKLSVQFPGSRIELTGVIVEAAHVGNQMISDLVNSLLLAVPLIAVVLIVSFRSVRLGCVSIIPNVFPLAATAATIALMGWHLRLFTVTIFAIVFGIAVDDTIHIMLRFQSRSNSGRSVRHSVLAAIRHIGPAVIATTLVLCSAMAVLLFSEIFGIRRFGFLMCCGLCWALVGDLVLLPACLASLMPERRDKRSRSSSNRPL